MSDQLDREAIVERAYSTAEEFLGAVAPMAEGRKPSDGWIFRGQADARWTLAATAMRGSDPFSKYGVAIPARDNAAWSVRKNRQDDILEKFRQALEGAGVVVPAASPHILATSFSEPWGSGGPIRSAFPLMALAQHHGLPTMLLDWTQRARIAAYFAAGEVAQNELPDERHPRRDLGSDLAVWGFRAQIQFWPVSREPAPGAPKEVDLLEIYQAPGSTNPNMRAQFGLFTLLSSTLDMTVEQHLARWSKKPIAAGLPLPLVRMTLPHSEARRLLRLLSWEGISGASMFPGTDGVVRAMHEKALWDEPDEGVRP